MGRRRRCSFVLLGIAVALASARAAAAEGEAEPLRIDYAAPAGCPDRDAFLRDVLRRTSRAREASGGEGARLLHVRVESRPGGFTGRLRIEDAGTASSAREITGATCSEVTSALGIVAALAVDPRASVAPAPTPPPPSASLPSSASPPSAPASAPSTSPDVPPPAETTPEQRRSPEPPVPARSGSVSAPARGATTGGVPTGSLWFGVGLQAEVATVAGAVLAGRLTFEVERLAPPKRIFAPSIRVGIGRSLDADREAGTGAASFRWTTGSVDVCPFAFALATSWALRPCAGFGAGIVDADARDVPLPSDRSRLWLTASAQARLVWAPVRSLSAHLEAGALAPLLRETFFFEPTGSELYRAPPVAFVARLGAAYRFP